MLYLQLKALNGNLHFNSFL